MDEPVYRHIDLSVLRKAVCGDATACRDLTLMYLEVAPPMHERLQQALRDADRAAIAYAAHALKGSTVLIGATALSAALQETELRARAGDGAALAAAAAGVAQLFDGALCEVLQSLAEGLQG